MKTYTKQGNAKVPLENYLYEQVIVKLKDEDKIRIGYFVKAQFFKNCYEVLPIDDNKRIAFCKSNIESIKFY